MENNEEPQKGYALLDNNNLRFETIDRKTSPNKKLRRSIKRLFPE